MPPAYKRKLRWRRAPNGDERCGGTSSYIAHSRVSDCAAPAHCAKLRVQIDFPEVLLIVTDKVPANLYQAAYIGSGTFVISKPKRKKAKKRQQQLKSPNRGMRK
jgi:hypothetical protein